MVCPVTSVVTCYFTDQIIKSGWFIFFESAVDLVINIKKKINQAWSIFENLHIW